jgi:hypothetical protein
MGGNSRGFCEVSKKKKKKKGKTSLTLLNFVYFCRYPLMFKSSHLGISNFDFLSLCPFCIENPNGMSILNQSRQSSGGFGVVLE